MILLLLLCLFVVDQWSLSVQTKEMKMVPYCPKPRTASIPVFTYLSKSAEIVCTRVSDNNEYFLVKANTVTIRGNVYRATRNMEYVLNSDVEHCSNPISRMEIMSSVGLSLKYPLNPTELAVCLGVFKDNAPDWGHVSRNYFARFNRALKAMNVFTVMDAIYISSQMGYESDGLRVLANLRSSEYDPNCDQEADDIWNFRGRGALRIEHRCNYQDAKDDLGVDFVGEQELATKLDYAFAVGAYAYAEIRGLKGMAQSNDEVTQEGIDYVSAEGIIAKIGLGQDGTMNGRMSALSRCLMYKFNKATCQNPFGCGNTTAPP